MKALKVWNVTGNVKRDDLAIAVRQQMISSCGTLHNQTTTVENITSSDDIGTLIQNLGFKAEPSNHLPVLVVQMGNQFKSLNKDVIWSGNSHCSIIVLI